MDEDPLGGEVKDRGYRGLVCRGRVRALERHILLVLLTTLLVERGVAGGQPKQRPLKRGIESEAPCAGNKSALGWGRAVTGPQRDTEEGQGKDGFKN